MKFDDITVVYGAERSGTTVFGLMLDGHKSINNPGEVDYLFSYLEKIPNAGLRYDLDGLREDREFRNENLEIPEGLDGTDLLECFLEQLDARGTGQLSINVHKSIDMVVLALPNARIIHMLRDPRDVARSCVGMGWAGTPYHGAKFWVRAERTWDLVSKYIPSEQIMSVRYENLMGDPENVLTRVAQFMGLEFDPDMLRYPETSTYSAPDPTLTNQWKGKMDDEMVALVEGRLGDLMVERGYDQSGVPSRTPSTTERIALAGQNKTKIWKSSVERHGLGLVLNEKISRYLGLRKANAQVRRRIDNQINAEMK